MTHRRQQLSLPILVVYIQHSRLTTAQIIQKIVAAGGKNLPSFNCVNQITARGCDGLGVTVAQGKSEECVFPNPNLCTSYISCVNDVAWTVPCPVGRVWDVPARVCSLSKALIICTPK
ncbi:hypothetical protein BGZ60DRAFT_257501 [Tricladium varicosporioides]|nr:hypothetical protein BGZ60DRAFT_257501 [Hymenoscyphus varicosporioides]